MFDDPLFDDGDTRDLRNITGWGAFFALWALCTWKGGLVGLAFGWIPSGIAALVVWMFAPLLWAAAFVVGAFLLWSAYGS